LGIEREAAQGVEHDAPRLARHPGDARREHRVVGQGGSHPHRDGVALGAPVVGALAARLPRDPFGVAPVGGDLAVERHRRLEQDPGAPGAGALAKGLVEQAGTVGQLAVVEHDLDAVVTQDAQPAARGVLGRVVGGDDHPQNPGLADGVGAGRGAAVVTAGLQGHVQGGAGQVGIPGGADGLDLRMGRAQLPVIALADRPVAVGDHRPDQGIGTDPAAALLRDLDRASQVAAIGIGDGGHVPFAG
jgi:hypothetical protein